MLHLRTKHYVLITTFLGSVATLLGSLSSYSDLRTKPSAAGAIVAMLASFIGALNVTRPRRPYGERSGDVGARKYAAVGLVLVGSMLASCGPKPYHIATVSVVGGHESLKFAAATLEENVCGKPLAPPEGLCVTEVRFLELAPTIAHGFHVDGQVAQLAHDWDPKTGPLPNFAPLLGDVTAVIQSLVDAMPKAAKAKTAAFINGR